MERTDEGGTVAGDGQAERQSMNVRRQLACSETHLSKYRQIRELVDHEMKVLGVGEVVGVSSCGDHNISRNLYYLLMAREMGDWLSCRRGAGMVPIWSFEGPQEFKPVGRMVDIRGVKMKVTVGAEIGLEGDECFDKGAELWAEDDVVECEGENALGVDGLLNKKDVVKGANNASGDQNYLARGEALCTEDDNENGTFVFGGKDRRKLKYKQRKRQHRFSRRRGLSDDEEEKDNVRILSGREKGVDDDKDAIVRKYVHPKRYLVETWEAVTEVPQAGPRTLQAAVYGSRWAVRRLGLEARITSHEGCVNALNFSDGSGEWLASGGDDRTVVVTDWQLGVEVVRFPSGHEDNIFQVRFLPETGGLGLVTCSRDGTVRQMVLSSCGLLRDNREVVRHGHACHGLAVPIDQRWLLLSAGEDSQVLATDLRSPECLGPLCSVDRELQKPIYSISCNPVRSQEFCVAGGDQHVFVFDRRWPRRPLYLLRPEGLAAREERITSVVYGGDGAVVLASYGDGDVYLLCARPGLGPAERGRFLGQRNARTIAGANFFGPRQEFVASGSNDGHLLIWERKTEALAAWLLADETGPVNVVEVHPTLPVIASAGHDYDVKLWSMLGADRRPPPRLSASSDLRGEEEDGLHPADLPFCLRELREVTTLNWMMRDDL